MITNGILLIILTGLIIVLAVVFFHQTKKTKARLRSLQEQEKVFAQITRTVEEEQKQLEQYKEQLRERIATWSAGMEQVHMEELRSYQNSVLSDLREHVNDRYWSDPVLNMVFRQKLEQCKEQGIVVGLEGFPKEGISLGRKNILEMVGLFANLSDNAMEACSFLPKEKRWTRLSFREAAGKLFFVLENSCSETQMKKSSEKTWKKNKEEHGLGKDIINEIVGRNNGWITFAQNTDVYRVEIMLPKS